MVAIRRTPAPPPQFDSQDSDSSVTATSSSKAKASHHASHFPEQTSPLANGKSREGSNDGLRQNGSRDTGAPRTKKSKGGRKTKNGGKKRKDKNVNLAEVLLRYLLLFFTIYSLSVCPHDAELKSPLCRGLSEYRRLILEPYILPAVNKALAHPSILPYVERAAPFANRAILIAKPVVLRTQLEWNHRVAPQWNKVIVPQYHKYLTPQLERASAIIHPYFSVIEEQYESLLAPHVRVIVSTANKFHLAVHPYILMAGDRTYSAYQTARPYLRPIWQRIRRTLKHLLIFLRAQRRQFVDPHVAKIWERVKELSRGDDETVTVQSSLARSVSLVVVETPVDSPVVQGSSSTLDGVESTSPSVETPVTSSSVSSLPSESFPTSTPVSQPLQSIGVTEGAATEAFSSATRSLVEPSPSPTKAHTSPVQETAQSPTTPSSTPPILSSVGGDVDLDAFYADIGFADEEPGEVLEDAHTESPALTEEQQEELRLKELAKTAEKRRDITSRHTKWEETLDELIAEKKKALRKALVALRKAAAQELKTNTDIHSAIEQLAENAEKLLKGADAYFYNLKTETRTTDEKVALWTKVLAKVDTKFTEHLRLTEAVVNGWYSSHLEKELQEVTQVAEEVREIADKAQADVGYDYIWLADVTYDDWQRYHALLGKSNNFTDLAKSIQNGSHPSPPIDPVPNAMHELELELSDVITGFETRFRRIKRNGFKALDSLPEETIDEEGAEQGTESPQSPEVLVVPPPGGESYLGTPVSGNDPSTAELPDVSILPIPGDESSPAAPVLGNEFQVVGRGKAEVEEALARAETVLGREDSQGVEHSTRDGPNEAGPSLVTPRVVPPSGGPFHAEL